MAIVMINAHREDTLDVTRIEHEQPIKAFGTNGSNESLRDRVRLWRLDRRTNDANPRTLKHLVEAAGELAVAIANQEANRFRPVRKGP